MFVVPYRRTHRQSAIVAGAVGCRGGQNGALGLEDPGGTAAGDYRLFVLAVSVCEAIVGHPALRSRMLDLDYTENLPKGYLALYRMRPSRLGVDKVYAA